MNKTSQCLLTGLIWSTVAFVGGFLEGHVGYSLIAVSIVMALANLGWAVERRQITIQLNPDRKSNLDFDLIRGVVRQEVQDAKANEARYRWR